ncbi:PadR family transcriptional regulator [Bacillus horti]|uniref:DNA-binding PadR family transcriptional regulator n=1 Tax=Caldalkalibacillus horti TaxID=77523 RepID=A0ABT9W524_9BACI|nr:PadR family transcriptional regulator [Bacillus horti]MDQ0168340.1 DNA-binding PadR family transcriptional regulator [Bacillus horti]
MKVNKELLKGSTVPIILSLLETKAMYGYEMIKEIEAQSGGIFAFKEGTLYPILHQLEAQSWVESYWDETPSRGKRKRKYYRITKKGLGQLQEKKKEWQLFRTTVDRVLGGSHP